MTVCVGTHLVKERIMYLFLADMLQKIINQSDASKLPNLPKVVKKRIFTYLFGDFSD